MKYFLLLCLVLPVQLFANTTNTKALLESMDRASLSDEQAILLDKALAQEEVQTINLDDSDLTPTIQNKRLRVRHIKRWLNTVNKDQTCMDEYLSLRKKQFLFPVILLVDTSLGVFVAIASGGWVPTLTVSFAFMRFFLSETIAGRIMRLRYPDVIPGQWNPYQFDAIANGISAISLIPYYVMGGISIAKFFNTTLVMKTLANVNGVANSKHFNKFRRQYLRKYPQDISIITDEKLSEILKEIDATGELCNGDIVKEINPRRYRRGRKLKQRLAKKKEIFKFIHQNI